MTPFDLVDDLVACAHSLPPAFGRHDELGAPVGRSAGPGYVAEVLQLVNDRGDRLLVPPCYPGQIRQPDAVFVEVGQHRAVARAQVAEALFRGACGTTPSATGTFPRCAVESFGAGRLVLGTDFPYEAGDIFVRAVDYISASGIPADQADAILEHNAIELLGIGSTPNR